MSNTLRFPNELILINHADGSQYPFELQDDFIYNFEHKGLLKGYSNNTYVIKVPKGYRTDLASVPRLLQGFINAVNDVAYAATVHDWIYSIELFDRKICDKIFKQALLDNNVGIIRASILYIGVVLGGWLSWPHKASDIYYDRELYKARFGREI